LLRLASASYDKTVKIWDAKAAICLQTFEGHRGSIRSVAFSPDGQRLASTSDDKTVKSWDAKTGICLQTLEGHRGWVLSVAFSKDGQQLVSASDDKTVKIWDVKTGTYLQTLEGHRGLVFSVAFSPDGLQLASASDDKTVKIWDAKMGTCLQTLEGHRGSVRSVAFSPDGSLLHTDIGTFSLFSPSTPARHVFRSPSEPEPSSLPPLPSTYVSYGLSSDGSWIMYNNRGVLWLPPDFRPVCSAVSGSTVAIGCNSGRVLVFVLVDQPQWG